MGEARNLTKSSQKPRDFYRKAFMLLALYAFFTQESFSQIPEIDSLEGKIAQTINKDPSRAGEYLKQLLKYQEQLHDTVIAKTYTQLGICFVRMAEYEKAFPYFYKGIEKASQFPEKEAKVSMALSTAHRSASNYDKSLSILHDVLDIYKGLQDRVGIATVYGEMASNYNYMLEDEKALDHLKRGIAILEEEGNIDKLAVLRQKLGNSYFNNGNFDFARDLYEEVLPVFKEQGSSNYYYTLLNYGDCHYYLEDLPEALKNYKVAEEGLTSLHNEQFALFALSKIARVYKNLGDFPNAKASYQKAFDGMYRRVSPRLAQVVGEYLGLLNSAGDHSTALKIIGQYNSLSDNNVGPLNLNYRDRLEILQQSYVAQKNSKNFEKALFLADEIEFLKDSVTSVRNEERIGEIQEKYQNEIQKEKNTLLQENILLLEKNIAKKNGIISLTILVLLMFLVISWFVVKRMTDRNKLKALQIELLDNKKGILEKKYREEERKRLEQEQIVEAKQREMVAVSIEFANIQRELKDLVNNEPPKIGSLKTKLLRVLNGKNYWTEFNLRFSEVHPQFYMELEQRFPALTKNDQQFCSFLRLGLTNKEIATLLGITPQSVITKKYRIRKKINMTEEQDFEEFLKKVSLDSKEKLSVAV